MRFTCGLTMLFALLLIAFPALAGNEVVALDTPQLLRQLSRDIQEATRLIQLKQMEGTEEATRQIPALQQSIQAKKSLIRKYVKPNLPDRLTRHWDPAHPGHQHKCVNCGRLYHQPGDDGPVNFQSGRCPHCGHENPVPGSPSGPVQGLQNFPCSRCGGDGLIGYQNCAACEGDGFLLATGNLPCQRCGGDGLIGYQNCTACSGLGRLNAWPGTGSLPFAPVGGQTFDCHRCGGDGLISYQSCSSCAGDGYGWTAVANPADCPRCGGDGLMGYQTCTPCAGLGVVHAAAGPPQGGSTLAATGSSVSCPRCDGDGTASYQTCVACEGDGWWWTANPNPLRCRRCDGDGLVSYQTCSICQGAGVLDARPGIRGLQFQPGCGQHVACGHCGGDGVYSYANCTSCGGDGYCWTPVHDPRPCGHCDGDGVYSYSTCQPCNGMGWANALPGQPGF